MHTSNKSTPQHRKKWRWLQIGCLGLLVLLTLLGVLFSVLVFNPFEGQWGQALTQAVPPEVDFCATLQNLRQHWQALEGSPWYRLQRRRWFQEQELRYWLAPSQYQALQRLLTQWRPEYRTYLFDLLGREVVVAGYLPRRGPAQLLLMTKISRLWRLAASLLRWVHGQQGPVRLSHKGMIHAIYWIPEGLTIYLARWQEVLLLATDQHLLQTAYQRISTGQGTGLGSHPIYLQAQAHLSSAARSSMLFINLQHLRQQQGWHLSRQAHRWLCPGMPSPHAVDFIKEILPLDQLNVWATGLVYGCPLVVENWARWERQHPHHPYYDGLQKTIGFPWRGHLPSRTFFYRACQVDPQTYWPFLLQRLGPWGRELRLYLRDIEKALGTPGLVQRELLPQLTGKFILALAPVDYLRANLQPFDPWPGAVLIAQTHDARKIMQRLLSALEKCRTSFDIGSIKEKNYGDHRLTCFRATVDFTGGALRPALAVVDQYIILSSHVVLLQEILDNIDQLQTGLDTQPDFRLLEKYRPARSTFDFYFSWSAWLDQYESQIPVQAENDAVNQINAGTNHGLDLDTLTRQLTRRLQARLEHWRRLKICLGLNFLFDKDEIKSKMIISLP